MRRSAEPGRSAAPTAATGEPAAELLRLQASAGNRAVTGLLEVQRDRDPPPTRLLEVQRDPDPPPSTPAPTIADQIAEARALVTKGEIDGPAFERYRTSTAGTVADVVTQLWQNELYLVEVDPGGAGIDKKADKKLVADFKSFVQARVAKALTAKLRALKTQVASSGTTVADQVEAIIKESPSWAEGTVADRLFVEWVGPTPVSARSPDGASDLWTALRQAGASKVASKRKDRLSKTAVAALDAVELNAAKTLLDQMTTWVVTPQDTSDLTDRVATALNRSTNHADAAWTELRDRMTTLILAAETEIINATVPQSKRNPLVPISWATFRNRYVATLTKPMWRFYRDNIVDAEILGEKVKASTDSSGVHKDVAAVLPLVEQSAMRLGGFATKADLIKANQRPGSEFRFEAMSHPDWMGRARHLSFHGTGRAMDFRAGTNPAFGGPTHQLVSILGGGELSELSAGSTKQRQELQKVAAHNADVVRLRGDLEARLAAATDPAEKTQLQADIARINQHLRDSVLTDETTVRVRERATDTHQKVKSIEARFIATWGAITLARSLPWGEDLASAMIGGTVDAAADDAKRALDAAVAGKSPDVSTLQARVRRIEEVRTLLNNPAASIDGTNRRQMLDKVGALSKSGITDMPHWMIEAYAERGWQWGMWSGFADAMHFDYMGPVADVREEAQYL